MTADENILTGASSGRWLLLGFISGAVLGVLDGGLTILMGERIPSWYAIAAFLFVALVGTVLGSVVALYARARTGMDATPARLFVPLAAGILLIYLPDKAIESLRFRHQPVWPALAGIGLAVPLVAWTFHWVLQRISRSRRAEYSALAGVALLSVWLTVGRALKVHFATYMARETLMSIGALSLLVAVAWFVLDRRLARDTSGRRPDLLATAAVLLIGAPLLLFALAQLRSLWDSEPLQRPRALEQSSPDPRPPVVLISIDTLRSDHLSLYGYPRRTSPRLEELADHAVTYLNAGSPSGWTLPGHASMFTGKFPTIHGAHYFPPPEWTADGREPPPAHRAHAFPLSDTHVTLAEILADVGYRTGAVVSNSGYLHRVWGFDQGFDYYDDRPRLIFTYTPVLHGVVRQSRVTFRRLTRFYRLASQINEEVFSWLDRHHDEPFFLFVNYMDPHNPYAPPPPFDEMFEADDLPEGFLRAPSTHALPPGAGDEWRRVTEQLASQYDGEIAYIDSEVGRLLDRMRELKLYDRALIVVTSDHGEFFGEHGRWGHPAGPFEQVFRVPLIVKYPGSHTTGRRPERVQTVDILPTILDAIGLEPVDSLDGARLGSPRRPMIAEQYMNTHARDQDRIESRGYRVIYEEPWKLVQYANGKTLLFDLSQDPAESENLAERMQDLTARLLLALERWVEEAERNAVTTPEKILDRESLDRLRALGYL